MVAVAGTVATWTNCGETGGHFVSAQREAHFGHVAVLSNVDIGSLLTNSMFRDRVGCEIRCGSIRLGGNNWLRLAGGPGCMPLFRA